MASPTFFRRGVRVGGLCGAGRQAFHERPSRCQAGQGPWLPSALLRGPVEPGAR